MVDKYSAGPRNALSSDMVDVPVELAVVMSMRALMVDRLRLLTANIHIVASQLVKLVVMIVIVNLYTITRLNRLQYRWMRESRDIWELMTG